MIRPDRALRVLLDTVRWFRENAALGFVLLTSIGGLLLSMLAAAVGRLS